MGSKDLVRNSAVATLVRFMRIRNRATRLFHGAKRRIFRQPAPMSTLQLHNKMFELAARQFEFNYRKLTEEIIEVGDGEQSCFISSTNLCVERLLAYWVCGDKFAANTVMQRHGLPVPEFRLVRSDQYSNAVAAWEQFCGPTVVKPRFGSSGAGVSVGVIGLARFRQALVSAGAYTTDLIIETFCPGRNYRLTFLLGNLIAAWERIPAHVVGDGVTCIGELLERYNAEEELWDGLPDRHPIVVSSDAIDYLAEQGYQLNSIPTSGATVYLHRACNAALGGRTRDVTSLISGSVIEKAKKAADVLGAQFAGVDLIVDDIEKSGASDSMIINEVNTTPDMLLANYDLSKNQSSVQLAGYVLSQLLGKKSSV